MHRESLLEMQTPLEVVLIEGILLSRSCSHLTWNGVKALALPNPSRTELSFHIHTRLGGSEEPRDRPTDLPGGVEARMAKWKVDKWDQLGIEVGESRTPEIVEIRSWYACVQNVGRFGEKYRQIGEVPRRAPT